VDGEVLAEGRESVAWNGKDDHGIRMRAGVYFVRIEARGQEMTSRTVLVE
jgi:hypothetical protein